MAWNANYPTPDTPTSESPQQQMENFQAIEAWWDVEHNTFTHSSSGVHRPGQVSTVRFGSAAAIAAITAPGQGALAYAEDVGTFLMYKNGWKRISEEYSSRVRNVCSQIVVPSGNWTVINTWNSQGALGMYDTLSEWANTAFIPRAAGYYLVVYSTMWAWVPINYQKAIGVFIDGTLRSIYRRYGMNILKVDNTDMLYLPSGSELKVALWQNSGQDRTVLRGSIYVQRLS